MPRFQDCPRNAPRRTPTRNVSLLVHIKTIARQHFRTLGGQNCSRSLLQKSTHREERRSVWHFKVTRGTCLIRYSMGRDIFTQTHSNFLHARPFRGQLTPARLLWVRRTSAQPVAAHQEVTALRVEVACARRHSPGQHSLQTRTFGVRGG